MIEQVTMYRVVCDDCGVSAQDDEVYAWSDEDQACDEARGSDWYAGDFGELCFVHFPRCPHGWEQTSDDPDEWLCEECEEVKV